jgi:magnesium transporter
MIKIWKQSGKGLVESAILERKCWLQVTSPTALEIESLQREYGIEPDVIPDILDIDERSRCEREDSYYLIITRVPIRSEQQQIPYHTIPFGIILTDEIVITVSVREPDFLLHFIEHPPKNIDAGNHNLFVLRLLQRAAAFYLRYLKDIHRKTGGIEKELQRSIKNSELVNLLDFEKSLVYFTTSLKSNELLLDKLKKTRMKNMSEFESDLFDDVVTESKQAIEMANIYSNILSGMRNAFASVISNNLNSVMKRLTMISITLMIPTLFASLYGMNISLPFQTSPFTFMGIVGVSLVSAIVGTVFFAKTGSFK